MFSSSLGERISAKFIGKTCLVPRSDESEGQGQRSKVKVTREKKMASSALRPASGLRLVKRL